MTDYIERETAKNILENTICLHEELPFLMDEIPAADVVEVVRCKDCRFTTGAAINLWNEPTTLCGRDGDIHPGNWFCAAGERENNDD